MIMHDGSSDDGGGRPQHMVICMMVPVTCKGMED